MNEDFLELKKEFLNEYKSVFLNPQYTRVVDCLKSLATLSSITGSMRLIREYYPDQVEKHSDVENAELIISTKVIPNILERFK